jgi:hypothetical protein
MSAEQADDPDLADLGIRDHYPGDVVEARHGRSDRHVVERDLCDGR